MGQTTSNVAKKVGRWAMGDTTPDDTTDAKCLTKAPFNPFVYKRYSHKFIDTDGDVAHEFYEQKRITYKTPNGKRKRSKVIMRKIPPNELCPVGMEELSHPCINVNYPLILCEASMARPT